MTVALLWRRLDTPGHDACRIAALESGWQITGSAVFLHNGTPTQLLYSLSGDPDWRIDRAAFTDSSAPSSWTS